MGKEKVFLLKIFSIFGELLKLSKIMLAFWLSTLCSKDIEDAI